MTDPDYHSPRRYFVDKEGRRVLIDLTLEETLEFEILEDRPALDKSGNGVGGNEKGISTTTREKRWLELYDKHDEGWRKWMVETYADRRGSNNFLTNIG